MSTRAWAVVALAAGLVLATAVQLSSGRWELTIGLLVLTGVGVVGLVLRRLHRLAAGNRRTGERLLALVRDTRAATEQVRDRSASLEEATRHREEEERRWRADLDERLAAGHADVRDSVERLSASTTSLAEEHRELRAEVAGARSAVAEVRGELERVQQELRRRAPAPTARRTPVIAGNDVVERMPRSAPTARVNLVLQSYSNRQLFAGVRTALLAGVHTARATGLPLRVLVLGDTDGDAATVRPQLADWIRHEAGDDEVAARVELGTPGDPTPPAHHVDDVWVVTYWATAVAVQRAVRAGSVDARRVLYLVQDWEPAFMPWGTDFALARGSYDAGFRLVVNSSPLAEFVRDRTGIGLPDERVFSPEVDVERLHRAAREWRPSDPDRPRVLVYFRPSKPRNLTTLALESLRVWADGLAPGVRPVVTLAGEEAGQVDLGPSLDVVTAGKLSLQEYYDLVARTDLALALMYSPHPSHLPLELPVAGVPTVTNALEGFRRGWVEGLVVADPTTEALSSALAGAAGLARDLRTHVERTLPPELGGRLEDAVRHALTGLP